MSDSSEEKSLPASEHKLRKAREKGQVSGSADFVMAFTVLATLVFLTVQWPKLVRMIADLFDASFNAMNDVTPGIASGMLHQTMMVLAGKMVILGLVLILVVMIANIVHKRGIPFSMHPVIPDFSRINPAQGFKKLASVRNAAEFSISLVRMLIWFAAAGMVLWFSTGALLRSVACGASCLISESYDTGRILVLIAAVMLIVAALLDLPLQAALFGRDQRMGFSEMKRERKDTHGNAEFRAHRQGQYRSMVDDTKASGVTFYLAGPDFLVGIGYDPASGGLPKVISRVREAGYEAVIERARKNRIPVVRHADLAADIFRTIDVGAIIRERHFERIALILLELGLVGTNR